MCHYLIIRQTAYYTTIICKSINDFYIILYFTEYESHLCISRTTVLNSIIISSAIMNYSVHKLHPILCQLNLGIETVTYSP